MSEENQFYSGDSAFKSYAGDNVYQNHEMTKAFTGSRTFQNIDSNISVKSEYLRQDYDYFRVNESVPTKIEDIITLSMDLYERNGIVKNVIDLMADFASQGIKLQHPSSSINKFYQVWADKINLKERSERFVNILLKAGNVVIKKSTTQLSLRDEKDWKKTTAADLNLDKQQFNRREIPIRYTMLLPTSFEVIGREVSAFIKKPIYVLKMPTYITSSLRGMGSNYPNEEQYLLEQIPADIKQYVKDGARYIPLDQDKITVYSYKKDDWEIWAKPLIRPILTDLLQLEKYKLADLSALDGAISNIRLWNLGFIGDSPQNSLLPTKAAMDKLRSILANNVGGGVLDLVWGPELKFQESNSQVWRWLGASKYEPVWNAIYDGLGIPPSMRTAGKGSSGTGNYVGLNTLIKRLQYVRELLISFWKKEIKAVHEAMNFSGEPPEIIFDFMVFADEAAEKKLWIELWDRDIVPTETIQEIFGRSPKFERQRTKKEYTKMENGTMPDKASPYHNSQKDHELKKIILQGGTVTPSEVGVELQPKKAGEKVPLQEQAKLKPKPTLSSTKPKKKGGRPTGVKETSKRKPKPKGKPSTKAAISTWAQSAYKEISNILQPIYLKSVGKSNLRKLTDEESDGIAFANFIVLCELLPFEEINQEKILAIVNKTDNKKYQKVVNTFNETKETFMSFNNREPSLDEVRCLYANAYSYFITENDDVTD